MLDPPLFNEYKKYGSICENNVTKILNIIGEYHRFSDTNNKILILMGITSSIATMAFFSGVDIDGISLLKGLVPSIFTSSLLTFNTRKQRSDINKAFDNYISCIIIPIH